MAFTSYSYLYFLLLIVLLRWTIPRRAASVVVLAASAFFLWTFGWLAGVLLVGAALLTWGAGLAMDRWPARRRALAAALVVLLVADLAVFKYARFLVAQVVALGGLLGHPRLLPLPHLVAPVAISFFTFQMIAYGIDACRGKIRVERDLLRFLAYVTFFPNVISGPIVRPGEILPQLAEPRRFDPEAFSWSVFLFAGGAFKKLCLADALAPAVSGVFDGTGKLGAAAAWVGSFAFTAQLYCDFSGYTDMARGAAGMLGLELPPNFRLPYLSTSIADFWRRWHMSLSYWLRDYVYIPLGGSRGGRLRTYRNLFLTMLIAGLWHGASWTMVAWGALHGAMLAVHRAWRDLAGGTARLARARASAAWRIAGALVTLCAVNLAWVFFRAPSFAAGWRVVKAMFTRRGGWPAGPEFRTAALVLAALAIGHALAANDGIERTYRRLSPAVRGLLWAALIVACFWLAAPAAKFIYVMF